MKRVGAVILLFSALLLAGCAPSVSTSVAGKEIKKADYSSYKGPRARVVVASFECNSPQCGGPAVSGGAAQVLNFFGINIPVATSGIGADVSTMLNTALVSSNHFVVYDRSIIT